MAVRGRMQKNGMKIIRHCQEDDILQRSSTSHASTCLGENRHDLRGDCQPVPNTFHIGTAYMTRPNDPIRSDLQISANF